MLRVTIITFVLIALAAAAAPTDAPTWAPKSDATIALLAKCAESRGSSTSDVYVEPQANIDVQNYRKGSYDLRANLATLPSELDFSTGYPAFPTAYSSVFVVLALPGIIFAVLGVACCLPCWCMKTVGENTAQCCGPLRGKGCCGACNDYVCGCRSLPFPSGTCRWGPVGDYGTFFPFAKFERNPNLTQDDIPSGCGLCKGTVVALEEGASYHDRDDFYSERSKKMEKRFSIPNLVWLAIIVACGVLICAFAIWGSVQLGLMIAGISATIEEGNCIVEDAINLVEEINKPLANISSIGQSVALNMQTVVAAAGDLGTEFAAIGTAMTALATATTADGCGFLATTFTTTETAATVSATSARYPSVDMITAAAVVTAAATEISAAQSVVDTMVGQLSMLTGVTDALNTTLVAAVDMASTITAGPMVDLLKDTVRPINMQIADYLGIVQEWQGATTTLLYVLIFIIVALTVATSVAWLITTELYECVQKKEEQEISANINGEGFDNGDEDYGGEADGVELVEPVGATEASGDSSDGLDAYTTTVAPVIAEVDHGDKEDEVEVAVGTCGDCICTIFQLSAIWTMHVIHFIGWSIMMGTFVAAAFFSPLTVLVSDSCTIMAHVANNPAVWLDSPSSPVKNITLAIDLVASCMDVENGNMLSALGVADQLNIVDMMDTGNGTSLDLTSSLDFSQIATMVSTVNALSNADLGWGTAVPPAPIASKLAELNTNTGGSYTDANCAAASNADKPDNNGACAPGASGSAETSRDDLIELNIINTCTVTQIASLKTDAAAIQVSVDAFKARMTQLQNDLNSAIPAAIGPITDNINALVGLGTWCVASRVRCTPLLHSRASNVCQGAHPRIFTPPHLCRSSPHLRAARLFASA